MAPPDDLRRDPYGYLRIPPRINEFADFRDPLGHIPPWIFDSLERIRPHLEAREILLELARIGPDRRAQLEAMSVFGTLCLRLWQRDDDPTTGCPVIRYEIKWQTFDNPDELRVGQFLAYYVVEAMHPTSIWPRVLENLAAYLLYNPPIGAEVSCQMALAAIAYMNRGGVIRARPGTAAYDRRNLLPGSREAQTTAVAYPARHAAEHAQCLTFRSIMRGGPCSVWSWMREIQYQFKRASERGLRFNLSSLLSNLMARECSMHPDAWRTFQDFRPPQHPDCRTTPHPALMPKPEAKPESKPLAARNTSLPVYRPQ